MLQERPAPARDRVLMLLFGRWTHTVHTSRLIRVIQLSLSSVHTQCCQDALETKGWLHSNRSQPAVAHWTSVRRCVHSSPVGRGLEEFFPKDDAIEEAEKTGQSLSLTADRKV